LTSERIISIYNKKLASLNTSFREKKIETTFGKTNILIFGDDKKLPLFLIHGLNSAAPFAFDTVYFLTNKYQIFAIDLLGEPNKSDFVRLNKKDNSYGKWLLEIIHHFKADSYTLCGISFGSFPILKSLLINDIKVKEAFLISPAAFIHGSLWKTIFKFIIPLKKFQKTKNEIYLNNCLSSIYDKFDELTLRYQKEVFTNFKMDFSPTPNFTKSELKKIKIPITIIASQNDFFLPFKKLKNKCSNLSNLKHFITLESSKHIPSKKTLEKIFNKITS
jgi:pimeloyl-ACP methyl ester carboxylesterase